MVGRGGHIVESQGSITLLPRGTLGSPVSPAMAEGASFYVGVFTVFAGLCLIVGMGFWSIYNPYKGEKFYLNNELCLNIEIFFSPNLPRARRDYQWGSGLWTGL